MNPLASIAEKVAEHDATIQRLTEQRQYDQQLDAMLKVLTTLYSNARSYNNLLIIAGYAVFFAIWGFLRDDISRSASHLALLLMLVSAVVFVLWEVAKMSWTDWRMKRKINAVLPPGDHVARIRRVEEAELSQAAIFLQFWAPQLIVTVGTGVAAIVVLFWNLVELVFWPSQWGVNFTL